MHMHTYVQYKCTCMIIRMHVRQCVCVVREKGGMWGDSIEGGGGDRERGEKDGGRAGESKGDEGQKESRDYHQHLWQKVALGTYV